MINLNIGKLFYIGSYFLDELREFIAILSIDRCGEFRFVFLLMSLKYVQRFHWKEKIDRPAGISN